MRSFRDKVKSLESILSGACVDLDYLKSCASVGLYKPSTKLPFKLYVFLSKRFLNKLMRNYYYLLKEVYDSGVFLPSYLS